MTQQLNEAAILLAVGMVVVFAFLSLLILGIKLIAAFVKAFPSDEMLQDIRDTTINNSEDPKSIQAELIAAITAAVHAHRRSNNRK